MSRKPLDTPRRPPISLPWLAAAVLAGPALAAPVPGASGGPGRGDEPADTGISFPDLARGFRESRGLGDGNVALGDALESGAYVSLDLGTFELWYPAEFLQDKKRAAELEKLVLSLVELHRVWTSWVDFGRDGLDQALEDLDTLEGWVESWSSGSLKRIEVGSSHDLVELLEAKGDVQEASRRLRAFAQGGIKSKAWDGGWAKLEESEGDVQRVRATRIVFAPNRRSFLEHVAFAGEVDPSMRSFNWSDASISVNSAWCVRTQIIALENPAWPPDPESPFEGGPMDHFDKTGQEQFVVERASISLLRDIYYYYGIHFFESALATNLVIAVFGRNSLGFTWSMSWGRQGAQTQSYSRFVPGGHAGGGTLPQRQAKSRVHLSASYISPWDKSGGEDFFLEPLQDAQEDGAKLARREDDVRLRDDDRAHFEIRTEDGKKTFVTAPFFGAAAETKPLPPNDFLDAYEDFFRAYRSAFFEWLRTRALGDEEESRQRFAALVEAQANRESDAEPLHAVVESVYGVPFSAEDESVDSLEWRFLAWLEDA